MLYEVITHVGETGGPHAHRQHDTRATAAALAGLHRLDAVAAAFEARHAHALFDHATRFAHQARQFGRVAVRAQLRVAREIV